MVVENTLVSILHFLGCIYEKSYESAARIDDIIVTNTLLTKGFTSMAEHVNTLRAPPSPSVDPPRRSPTYAGARRPHLGSLRKGRHPRLRCGCGGAPFPHTPHVAAVQ